MTNKGNFPSLRELDESEIREWKASPKSSVTGVFWDFLFSKMMMAEIMVNQIPLREKTASEIKGTRQDRIASSFYAWRRKHQTKEAMQRSGIENMILIRRGNKLALKKKFKNSKRRKKQFEQ